MKRTSFALSFLLILFAGGVQAKEVCEDSISAKKYPFYCKEFLRGKNDNLLLVGKIKMIDLRDAVRVWSTNYAENKVMAISVDGMHAWVVHNYMTLWNAKLQAKTLCQNLYKKLYVRNMPCVIVLENDKAVNKEELREAVQAYRDRAKKLGKLEELEELDKLYKEACEDSIFKKIFPNYCKEFLPQENKDSSLLVGRVNMPELREIVKIWEESYLSNKAIAIHLDGKEAYICHGYTMLSAAKRCALMGCGKDRDVPCAIVLENNNEVDIDEEVKAYRNRNK